MFSGYGDRLVDFLSASGLCAIGASCSFPQPAGVLYFQTDNTSTTGTNVTLALSGSSASYQGLSNITLRFYGWNSEATAGTGGLQGPLSFTGSLIGSGGSSYTWAGGAGNWENGQTGNFGQTYTNSPTATATFTGAGGAVAVSGTVEAASVTIGSSGYAFSGGTISLANGLVESTADSASIASVITGTNGFAKSGTGSLTLGGAGTINGAVVMASNSILAPGTSPGTLTIGNSLLLNDATILCFEPSASDQTVGGGVNDLVTGITNLTLDAVLNISPIGDFTTVAAGTKWRLLDDTGTFSDLSLALGSMPTLGTGNSFAIDTSVTGQVNLQVVPEPSSIAIIGLGLAATGYAAYRRRLSASWGRLARSLRTLAVPRRCFNWGAFREATSLGSGLAERVAQTRTTQSSLPTEARAVIFFAWVASSMAHSAGCNSAPS